jgi:hypothetical protein
MKHIIHIFAILILIVFFSCKKDKINHLQENNASDKMILSNTPKASALPSDTLDFLDYEELLYFQKAGFDDLFQMILPYALSSEIAIIRNEIFARKGYIFQSVFLQEYFHGKDWYNPRYTSLDSIHFSRHERALVDTLLTYEKANAFITRDTIKRIFLEQYITNHITANSEYSNNKSKEFSLALWAQAVDRDRGRKSMYKNANCMTGTSPWDYSGSAYHIAVVDTINSYYHFILEHYFGAEGCSSFESSICILNKNLDIVDSKTYRGCCTFEKIGDNMYKYTVSEESNENPEELITCEDGIYNITSAGMIQYK